jgi:hypothetical protein
MDRTTARAANMAVQDGVTMITGKMVMAATGTVVTITMIIITTTMDTIAMGTMGMITTGMISITKRSTTTITKMIEGRLAAGVQQLVATLPPEMPYLQLKPDEAVTYLPSAQNSTFLLNCLGYLTPD